MPWLKNLSKNVMCHLQSKALRASPGTAVHLSPLHKTSEITDQGHSVSQPGSQHEGSGEQNLCQSEMNPQDENTHGYKPLRIFTVAYCNIT